MVLRGVRIELGEPLIPVLGHGGPSGFQFCPAQSQSPSATALRSARITQAEYFSQLVVWLSRPSGRGFRFSDSE